MDDCLCQVCLDFGGRPWLVWDAEFNREKIGEMPTEMFLHLDVYKRQIVLRASIKEVKRNIVIIEAKLYNKDGEVCTEAVCTYFTFSHEKSKDEMHFDKCDVEPEEILPLI